MLNAVTQDFKLLQCGLKVNITIDLKQLLHGGNVISKGLCIFMS